jgi:hypothetical protein
MIDILVLLGLAGFWGVLRGTGAESPTPFWRDHERWVEIVLAGLFAALVIGYGGQLLGFRAPVAFALGGFFLLLTLTRETESTSSAIDRANGGSKDGRPLVAAHRGQLLRRALARVGLKQPPPVNDFTPPLKLPSERAAGSMALSIGPEGNWWQNGLEAWRLGVWLAGLPVAYFIYVFLSTGAGGWSWSAPFATAGLVSAFVFEVAFWLVAAFTFGCLFPYLRGQNGLIKGVALAAVYIAAHAAAALLGIPGNALWQVRSFQLLLFLILLGAWLDFRSLETCGYSWRELIALYELPRTTTLIRQGLPLVIALAGVLVQLYSHQTQAATESLLTGDASQAILCFLQSVSNAPCR